MSQPNGADLCSCEAGLSGGLLCPWVWRLGGSELQKAAKDQAMRWTDTRHVQIENRGQVDGLLEDIMEARPPLRNLRRHLLRESVCTAANQHAGSA